MKQLVWVIVAMLVLGVVVPSCDDTPRYDSRLTTADSLIHDHADSALAILETLSPSDLATEGDRAYRALLLTQARYRACIPATSDSDINRALSYYKHHPKEREKLTRVHLFNGTTLKELGFPDSAMLSFKKAEVIAASDDYNNLGYIKLQMGALYNDYYSLDGEETVKYEEALECFTKAKDSVYILLCLNNLGCLYRVSNPQKAESMLLEASRIARQLHDTITIAYNDLSQMVLYFHQGKYEKARRLFGELSGFDIYKKDYKMCFTAANVYARLGVLDSAELYLNLALLNRNDEEPVYRMYHLRCLSELALAKKDIATSLSYGNESDRIEDSLTSNDKKLDILQAEVSHDKESVEKTQFKHKSTVNSYQWLIGFLVCASALILFWVYRRTQRKAHRYDSIISDLKEEITNQSINMNTLQNNINSLKINDENLKEFITSHNNMMREMIEKCYHLPHGPLAKEIRKIIKYQDENTGIWEKLYCYLDMEYNNIMSETRKNYPMLDEKDLLMIALTCMGYSCAQISIVLDYSSSSGISTIRKRIASKMGLDCLLGEYIKQFKPEC